MLKTLTYKSFWEVVVPNWTGWQYRQNKHSDSSTDTSRRRCQVAEGGCSLEHAVTFISHFLMKIQNSTHKWSTREIIQILIKRCRQRYLFTSPPAHFITRLQLWQMFYCFFYKWPFPLRMCAHPSKMKTHFLKLPADKNQQSDLI